MTGLGIAVTVVISMAAVLMAIQRPGGCLRYSFLCGTLYLAWIVPQLIALDTESTPEDGLFWLVVMVALCLGASLFGWRIGTRRQRRAMPVNFQGQADLQTLFWPVAALTAFVFMLHVLIRLQPLEALQQTKWSGPLTIIAFFLSLSVIGLYLSLLIAFRERSPRAFILAGVNILLSGAVAFIALRRGELVDFGVATVAALWFGARKRIPIPLVATAIIGMVMVAYAIVPLRIAAREVAETTGSRAGLLSTEVWRRVDFADAVQKSSQRAVDLSNAVHLIDSTNRWGEFTLGQRSWDRFVFQWVPAQILGADFKNGLMFEQGTSYEQIQLDYAFTYVGGTTSTGFAFAYQEFGPFGFIYFLLIGILMGRLWSRAETGDVWSQALYVSFAGGALLSVTHHAMWLAVQTPLFATAVFILKRASGQALRRRRLVGGYHALRH